jgi:hypothetical protein
MDGVHEDIEFRLPNELRTDQKSDAGRAATPPAQ